MTNAFERPAARRRARPAADDAVDPMDTAAPPPQADAGPSQAPSSGLTQPTPGRPPSWSVPETSRAPIPAAGPPATRASSGAYVTLNVRVAPDVDELINRVMAETGMTKRAAVERALRHTYG